MLIFRKNSKNPHNPKHLGHNIYHKFKILNYKLNHEFHEFNSEFVPTAIYRGVDADDDLER